MPTKTDMRRESAVAEPPIAPSEDDLKNALGCLCPVLNEALSAVQAVHPRAVCDWKFSPRAGWYQICSLERRRLFYIVPKRGAFRISMILGARAVTSLQLSLHSAQVTSMLRSAKRYPEGTAFVFTAEHFDAELFLAFVEAKVAS
jgi:hypothetical protein